MNERIKQLWLDALRSGEYKQTARLLRKGDAFCCLGVLCDLHQKEVKTGELWEEMRAAPEIKRYLNSLSFLPPEVVEWAGLSQRDPVLQVDSNPCELSSCTSLNDSGMTFSDIANLIEAQL